MIAKPAQSAATKNRPASMPAQIRRPICGAAPGTRRFRIAFSSGSGPVRCGQNGFAGQAGDFAGSSELVRAATALPARRVDHDAPLGSLTSRRWRIPSFYLADLIAFAGFW
ncbi:hypothetical protein KCP69_04625 [Salmonella enterica subsp. enterica]|nr:hypothetical protein KCP69_04625 [Salmonella enterica subsp. enterica]